MDFLNRAGPQHQFFPQYVPGDFFSSEGTFRNLAPADLLLAFRQAELVGMLGGWDQTAFRQTLVAGYHSTLRWIKHFHDIWAGLRGLPRLPEIGTCFHYLMGALPVVDRQQPEVLVQLLESLLARFAGGRFDYLLVGLHESNVLLKWAAPYGITSYVSQLYCACWGEGEPIVQVLDDRPPYLELGCL